MADKDTIMYLEKSLNLPIHKTKILNLLIELKSDEIVYAEKENIKKQHLDFLKERYPEAHDALFAEFEIPF